MFESIIAMYTAVAPMYFSIIAALVLGFGIGLAVGALLWPQTTDEFAIKMLEDF